MSLDKQDQGTRETKEGFRPVHLIILVETVGAITATLLYNFGWPLKLCGVRCRRGTVREAG